MRVSMLVEADGSLSFVSDAAAQLDPRLLRGVRVRTLEGLEALETAVVEARTQGRSDRTAQLGEHRFEVHADRAGTSAVFLSLTQTEETITPTLGDLELVDVVLSGEPLPRILDELCRVAGSLTGLRCAVMLLGDDGLLHFGGGPKLPQLVRDLCQNVAPGAGRGACAEAGGSLAEVVALGRRVAQSSRSFGVALTSCTTPAAGRPTFVHTRIGNNDSCPTNTGRADSGRRRGSA
mgnify:CR=1 FL=1